MPLRNGKEYLTQFAKDFPHSTLTRELSPHAIAILRLLRKIAEKYYVENIKNEINITPTEFINQKIRDCRELFFLTDYYFESLNSPIFTRFWSVCKRKVACIISELNVILTNSNPDVILRGNDKTNANGLLKDLQHILQRIIYIYPDAEYVSYKVI